ncbi:uncharacterized protein LOC124316751 [Daphnia pulicaria]|uniref:uncharacterized protein LOC124316746 n=1 Tax=Daphnia pulicaria TaxID=35523 RepID=UPI001EEBF790|nr:uncharacterized protein LOC124316746 [Daphnia pulicaria]XP_046638655.1 uncharacterized protein LOC124316751 [Daphnia pulicaria]
MSIVYSRSEILACRPRQCPKLSLSLHSYRLLRLRCLLTRLRTSRSRKRKRRFGTRLCLINAGSVVNKLESFTTVFSDHSPDVVALTETWLTHVNGDQILSSMVPGGFSFIQVPRPSSRRGGGVAVVFKSTIAATLVTDSQAYDSFEYMDVRLKFGTRTLRLLVVYRPPRCSESDFLRDFSCVLEILLVTRDDVLIVGDFNLHVDDEHDQYGRSFMSLIDSCGLQQHVVGPTHERSATHKRHTLDLVLSRQRNHLVSKVCVGPRVISDHHPVLCVLDLHPPRWLTKKLLTRSLKSIDWDKFATAIANLPLLSAPSDNLDGLVEQYNNGLRAVLDLHAPVRTRTVTLWPVNRWMTTEILDTKTKLRHFERCWRSRQLAIDFEIFQTHLLAYSEMLKAARTLFFSTEVRQCRGDMRALYRLVGDLMGSTTKPSLPTRSSDQEVADDLN